MRLISEHSPKTASRSFLPMAASLFAAFLALLVAGVLLPAASAFLATPALASGPAQSGDGTPGTAKAAGKAGVPTLRKRSADKAGAPSAEADSKRHEVQAEVALGGAVEEARAVAGRLERLAAEAEKELAELRLKVERPDADEKLLREARGKLNQLSLRLLAARKDLEQPLGHMRQQLKALGPAPKAGETEDPGITARRKLLARVVHRMEAVDRRLELLLLEMEQLHNRATERQRSLFFSEILKPARSILNPFLWTDGLAQLPEYWQRLRVMAGGWLSEDARFSLLAAMALILLALAGVVWLWRQWRGPWEKGGEAADEVQRLWRAVRVPLFVALLTFLLMIFLKIVLFTLGTPSPRMERLLSAFAGGTLYAVVLMALARGILRPRTPHMRLVDIAHEGATRAYRWAALVAILHGLDVFIVRSAAELFMPVSFIETWSAFMAAAHVVLVWLLIMSIRRARALSEVAPDSAPKHFLFGWVRYVFHVILLLLAIIVLALLLGYVALAHFIARQMVFTAALVASLYLVHHLADALVKSAFDPASPVGRFLREKLLVPEGTISRAGVLFSTLVDVVVVLIGLPLILMQWAVQLTDVWVWLRQGFFGFRVGNITIEPANILLGIVVFIIGLMVVRLLILWLDRRVLARSDMDDGIRNSILTVVRYAGIVGAFLVAISVAGMNLASFALFGGALGIGIGFGLQTIVNNFVSGLILLAERPIKVGDRIRVAGEEGIVKRIRVRSTEIETFDRVSVIVPNSQLISEPVLNWYHENRMGRVRVPVGVSYDADPEQVRDILLKCAREHPKVLGWPDPFVQFMGFGASSLDFELRAYIPDAGQLGSVSSDLHYAIFRALKNAGIEIPFPQRDLHVRSVPPELAGARGIGVGAGGSGPARPRKRPGGAS